MLKAASIHPAGRLHGPGLTLALCTIITLAGTGPAVRAADPQNGGGGVGGAVTNNIDRNSTDTKINSVTTTSSDQGFTTKTTPLTTNSQAAAGQTSAVAVGVTNQESDIDLSVVLLPQRKSTTQKSTTLTPTGENVVNRATGRPSASAAAGGGSEESALSSSSFMVAVDNRDRHRLRYAQHSAGVYSSHLQQLDDEDDYIDLDGEEDAATTGSEAAFPGQIKKNATGELESYNLLLIFCQFITNLLVCHDKINLGLPHSNQ